MSETNVKVKVKFALEECMKAREEWNYVSTLSLTSTIDGGGGYRHAPAALLPGKIPGTNSI